MFAPFYSNFMKIVYFSIIVTKCLEPLTLEAQSKMFVLFYIIYTREKKSNSVNYNVLK